MMLSIVHDYTSRCLYPGQPGCYGTCQPFSEGERRYICCRELRHKRPKEDCGRAVHYRCKEREN